MLVKIGASWHYVIPEAANILFPWVYGIADDRRVNI